MPPVKNNADSYYIRTEISFPMYTIKGLVGKAITMNGMFLK